MAVTFSLILTGTPDATSDLDLSSRVTALSVRLMPTGENSTISATLAGVSDLAAGIAARPNGEVVASHIEGGTTTEFARALVSADPETSRTPEVETTTLEGVASMTFGTPTTRAITGVTYRRSNGGTVTLRGTVDPLVIPGDTVTNDADSFVAGQVVFTIGATATMEATE